MRKIKKIIIIGCSGSGKSTLAQKLKDILSLPAYHLDSLFYKPNWVKTTKEEWIAILEGIIRKEEWIMDGTYGSTLEMRARHAEMIILLNYSTLSCLKRIFKRYDENQNKDRVDRAEGCDERIDIEFIRHVLNFKEEHKKTFSDLKKKFPDKKFVTLKNDEEVKAFLDKVSEDGAIYV